MNSTRAILSLTHKNASTYREYVELQIKTYQKKLDVARPSEELEICFYSDLGEEIETLKDLLARTQSDDELATAFKEHFMQRNKEYENSCLGIFEQSKSIANELVVCIATRLFGYILPTQIASQAKSEMYLPNKWFEDTEQQLSLFQTLLLKYPRQIKNFLSLVHPNKRFVALCRQCDAEDPNSLSQVIPNRLLSVIGGKVFDILPLLTKDDSQKFKNQIYRLGFHDFDAEKKTIKPNIFSPETDKDWTNIFYGLDDLQQIHWAYKLAAQEYVYSCAVQMREARKEEVFTLYNRFFKSSLMKLAKQRSLMHQKMIPMKQFEGFSYVQKNLAEIEFERRSSLVKIQLYFIENDLKQNSFARFLLSKLSLIITLPWYKISNNAYEQEGFKELRLAEPLNYLRSETFFILLSAYSTSDYAAIIHKIRVVDDVKLTEEIKRVFQYKIINEAQRDALLQALNTHPDANFDTIIEAYVISHKPASELFAKIFPGNNYYDACKSGEIGYKLAIHYPTAIPTILSACTLEQRIKLLTAQNKNGQTILHGLLDLSNDKFSREKEISDYFSEILAMVYDSKQFDFLTIRDNNNNTILDDAISLLYSADFFERTMELLPEQCKMSFLKVLAIASIRNGVWEDRKSRILHEKTGFIGLKVSNQAYYLSLSELLPIDLLQYAIARIKIKVDKLHFVPTRPDFALPGNLQISGLDRSLRKANSLEDACDMVKIFLSKTENTKGNLSDDRTNSFMCVSYDPKFNPLFCKMFFSELAQLEQESGVFIPRNAFAENGTNNSLEKEISDFSPKPR